MATVINALGDQIKIDRAFVSGKDRIQLNDEVVFEESLGDFRSEKFASGSRTYELRKEVVSSMTKAIAFHLQIFENGEEIHSGIYDLQGQQLTAASKAGSPSAAQACAKIGTVIGIVSMLSLNSALGIVPESLFGGDTMMSGITGRALMGAIGGGLGSAIGYGFGGLVFGSNLS